MEHIKMMLPYLRQNYNKNINYILSQKIKPANNNNNIYLELPIHYSNHITFKKNLCKLIREYNRDHLIPKTYIMPEEFDSYKKECAGKKMILKSNSQRQEGLYIANNILPYNLIKREKIVVAQEYISDCLKYEDYKLAVRIWIIIHCHNNYCQLFFYKNGLIYYSAIFDEIASFYDSKVLYNNNYPMMVNDLPIGLRIKMNDSIKNILAQFGEIIKDKFTKINANNNDYYYELFGIDIHLTANFKCFILEINSGPGMKPCNEKDKVIRYHVLKGYNDIIHNINNDSFWFI